MNCYCAFDGGIHSFGRYVGATDFENEVKTFESARTAKLLGWVQPALATHLWNATASVLQKSWDAARLTGAAMGISVDDLKDVPVTHPAHSLPALHRALGFEGNPLERVWPEPWSWPSADPLVVPLPDGHRALLVGWALPMAAAPYIEGNPLVDVRGLLELSPGSPDLVRCAAILFHSTNPSLRCSLAWAWLLSHQPIVSFTCR